MAKLLVLGALALVGSVSGAPAPACDQIGQSVGYNLLASDIGRVDASSSCVCKKSCDDLPACGSWTYNSGSCYLHKEQSKSFQKSSSGDVSGTKAAFNQARVLQCTNGCVDFSKENYVGDDVDLFWAEGPCSCEEACANNAACATWSYDTSNSHCYLKGSKAVRTPWGTSHYLAPTAEGKVLPMSAYYSGCWKFDYHFFGHNLQIEGVWPVGGKPVSGPCECAKYCETYKNNGCAAWTFQDNGFCYLQNASIIGSPEKGVEKGSVAGIPGQCLGW